MKKSLQNLNSNIGFNEPQKWTKEHFKNVQNYIKNQYEQYSPNQKLEIRLYALKIEMEHYLLDETPKELKSIGYFIREGINAFKEYVGISQKYLGEYWGISQNLGKYLNNERPISPELAMKIAATFSFSPKLLLHIQNKNELLEIEKNDNYKTEYSMEKLIQKFQPLSMRKK